MREREREREGMKEREKKYRTLTHIVTLPTIWQMVLMASTTMLAVLVVVVKGAVLAVRMWLDPWQRRQRRQRGQGEKQWRRRERQQHREQAAQRELSSTRRGSGVLAERQQRVRARLVQWQTRVLTGSPPTHSCLLAYCCRCAAAAEERCSRLLQWLRWLRKGACLFAPARKRAKAENHRAHSQ